MKARLYRGPFADKVMETDGRNHIVVRGPKKMSRKDRYEWQREQYQSMNYGQVLERGPMVEAVYRICMGPFNQPLRHPDGSIFYEWDKKSVSERGRGTE